MLNQFSSNSVLVSLNARLTSPAHCSHNHNILSWTERSFHPPPHRSDSAEQEQASSAELALEARETEQELQDDFKPYGALKLALERTEKLENEASDDELDVPNLDSKEKEVESNQEPYGALKQAQEIEASLQPYGALKIAVAEEPWGALKVSIAISEKERKLSERLLEDRQSIEVRATAEPDSEVVESGRAEAGEEDAAKPPVTTLILRPYAKAVAGAGGTAIAAPESRAVTSNPGDVVIFEPETIALAGPGGKAIARATLIIESDRDA